LGAPHREIRHSSLGYYEVVGNLGLQMAASLSSIRLVLSLLNPTARFGKIGGDAITGAFVHARPNPVRLDRKQQSINHHLKPKRPALAVVFE
jgi:hypothetical protein